MEFFYDHTDNCFQVIQRIFYNVNRSWSGKITCSELRKSNFLQVYCTTAFLVSFCVVLQKVKLTGNLLGAPPQPFYFLGLQIYKYNIIFKWIIYSLQVKLVIYSKPYLRLNGKQSNVLYFFEWQNVALLEQEEDVNQLTEFFSYEHFYVIYCKFWELDTDHDLYIDQRDLAQHNDQGATSQFHNSFLLTVHEVDLSCGALMMPALNIAGPFCTFWDVFGTCSSLNLCLSVCLWERERERSGPGPGLILT